jgi:hypothetical protein
MPAQHHYHYLALGQAVTHFTCMFQRQRPIPHICLLHPRVSKGFPGARKPLLHKWHNMLRGDLPGCHRYILVVPSMVQLLAWVYNTWRNFSTLSEFMIIYGHYLQVQVSGFTCDKLAECF